MADNPTKIILHCPLEHPALLNDFVEDWIAAGVELIAAFGAGAEDVHDLIDDMLVRVREDDQQFITTTWHDSESLSDVIDFASSFGRRDAALTQIRL